MEWTWTGIASLALVRSGFVGRGQPITAPLLIDAINALELLLDRWDGEGLALPDFDSSIIFNTISNQAKYTLGPGGDFAIRPETIVTATCTVSANPAVRNELVWIDYEQYTIIPTPEATIGQPWNYTVNQKWPKMEFFLYPTPSQVYPITLNCKIKWADTVGVGDPIVNPFSTVEVPSGYVDALVSNLALDLAKIYRLETKTLEVTASDSRFMVASAIYSQHRDARRAMPIGVMPWNTGISGRNP